MAVRSVLEVEVSDDAFQKFKASFEKYQSAVKELPGQWSKVGTAAEGASNNFADMVAALLAGNEQLLRVNRQTTAFGQAIHGADGGLQKIVSHTHRIAGNIGETTKHLLKWTSIFSAVGGLLGAGSLWGLDRLARDAGTGRRSSMGLGLSFGEQRAFSTDIGRLVDPDQLLGGVNTAMTDVTQRWRLYGTGLTERDIAGKDTAAVSVEVLQSLKRIADTTNPAMYGQILQARGLDQFASTQDLNRLRATSPQEFNQILQSYQRDRQKLGVPNDVLKKWQDLSVQLSRAGQQIESTLIRGLSPLAPQLEKLSSAFSDAVASLLQSPQVKQWIGDLADGIKSFATEITTPEFQKGVTTFVSDIGTLAEAAATVAHKLSTVAQWLGLTSSGDTGKPGAPADEGAAWGAVKSLGRAPGDTFGEAWSSIPGHPGFKQPAGPGAADQRPFSWWNPGTWLYHKPDTGPDLHGVFDWFNPIPSAHAAEAPGGGMRKTDFSPLGPVAPLPDQQMQKVRPVIDQLEKLGWSAPAAEGVAANIWRESKVNPAAIGDSGSAYGLGQWHPDRQADFRAAFGRDIKGSSLDQQVAFIDYELRHKEDMAGHMLSTAKSAAEAAAIISKYYERPRDKQGEAHSRAEIAARISAADQGNRRQPPPSPTRIVVENRTGGSAAISASTVAGPG